MNRFMIMVALVGAFGFYQAFGNSENAGRLSVKAAAQYIDEFGGPVSPEDVVAFMAGEKIGDDSPPAIFLTEEKLVFYSPDDPFSQGPVTIALNDVRNMRFGPNKPSPIHFCQKMNENSWAGEILA